MGRSFEYTGFLHDRGFGRRRRSSKFFGGLFRKCRSQGIPLNIPKQSAHHDCDLDLHVCVEVKAHTCVASRSIN